MNPPSSLKANLALSVKRERQQLGISQDELAKRCGLHRTYLSDLERGACNPRIDTLQKIARALRISVTKLLQDHET